MKRLLLSAIVSLVLNAGAFVANYIGWHRDHWLPLAVKMHGGEVTSEFGFGLRAVHLYGMTPDQAATHSLVFDPVSMVLCLLLGTGIVFLLLLIGGKVFKR